MRRPRLETLGAATVNVAVLLARTRERRSMAQRGAREVARAVGGGAVGCRESGRRGTRTLITLAASQHAE